jgi:hypothetical protein
VTADERIEIALNKALTDLEVLTRLAREIRVALDDDEIFRETLGARVLETCDRLVRLIEGRAA